MFKLKFTIFLLSFGFCVQAQQQVLDKVIGVVAKYPILLSDLQNTMLENEEQGYASDKCKSFEMLVFQKLLLAQADRDSVVVDDKEVEQELSRRMAYFIQKFGSEQKLETFYGKRTNVIKDELRHEVQEQLVANKMQEKITGDVKLTPAEVKAFYNALPSDSLPFVNSEVELQQLVKKPGFSADAKQEAKEKLEEYRQRVLNSNDAARTMSTMARMYSDDPGSAPQGGFYASVAKGVMDPSFESVAFRLKNGEISTIFETAYGYHFIRLVQRKGELLDLQHILIQPKMTNEDFFRCKQQLDTIYNLIKEGKISFEEAVRKYSDDADTKQNAGLMINPQTASTKFDNEILNQIDDKLVPTLTNMQIGDISAPTQYAMPDGKPAFRILKLKNRIDPHKTNLKDDYQKLANMATADKKQKQIKEFIKKRSKITYIKLDPQYSCKFENDWTITE
ncbi:MAG: peptidylprolyl isomerase [Bacteroidetes bacterium]|nr:peptidylprolyl isomerase [Bacteroidota bacterium]